MYLFISICVSVRKYICKGDTKPQEVNCEDPSFNSKMEKS